MPKRDATIAEIPIKDIVDAVHKVGKKTVKRSTKAFNSDYVYTILKVNCIHGPDKCKTVAPWLLNDCEEKKIAYCKNIVYDGVTQYCEGDKSASVCEQWLTTTSSHILYFAIGGVVGVIVLLAVAIGVFCYCRRKKKMGKNQTMTGTTTGGTSGTGTGAATGTNRTNGTGTNQATGTNTCAKY